MVLYGDSYWVDNNPRFDTRKSAKIAHDPTKHYPNKNEARLLRKIKSITGMTEEEICSHPKYRIMLSEAQKEGQKPKRTHQEKFYHWLIKRACRKTGLVKEHPETIKVLDEIIIETFDRSFVYGTWYEKLTAKKVVELYGKTYK